MAVGVKKEKTMNFGSAVDGLEPTRVRSANMDQTVEFGETRILGNLLVQHTQGGRAIITWSLINLVRMNYSGLLRIEMLSGGSRGRFDVGKFIN